MKDNKLIAEFMGLKDGTKYLSPSLQEPESIGLGMYVDADDMRYHASWDWLMPVVDKIESFEDENRCAKYNVNMLQCWVEIINNDTSEEIVEAEGINKLQATYHAVVEFIKFYNNQNK